MSQSVLNELVCHINLSSSELIELALARREGTLCSNKALRVTTGKRTGRSPQDRFIVKDELTRELINWGPVNQAYSPQSFSRLWQKAQEYIKNKEHFVSHMRVSSDDKFFVPVEVVTELAWHSLFANNLFIKAPSNFAAENPMWSILNVPGFKTNPITDETKSDGAVIINLSEKKILICGILYAGEMKKAMFSVLNYLLPAENVLPMHCAANIGDDENVVLFFGLSGTGKTTLSADPKRLLIGDDEHGWSETGIFNFEGGCYAKCINLSQENEPLIWNAIHSGTILENVVLDPITNQAHYEDTSITENTRAAYPREHIKPKSINNYAGHPDAVIFLCCDLYGVLPPVAKLTRAQAAYYFLSGYTALVGSTEIGQASGVRPTFSTCFGAPFFPHFPHVYADLLLKRLDETNACVYLVNTGWSGGKFEAGGERFSIPTTRNIIYEIIAKNVEKQDCELLPGFNFMIPRSLNSVDDKILDPRKTWQDQASYHVNSQELISKFIENFKQFNVSMEIKQAGPSLK